MCKKTINTFCLDLRTRHNLFIFVDFFFCFLHFIVFDVNRGQIISNIVRPQITGQPKLWCEALFDCTCKIYKTKRNTEAFANWKSEFDSMY